MRAAVVQINSTGDRAANLEAAERQVRAAASGGATLVVLPEKWPLMADGEDLAAGAEPVDGPAVSAARSWAAGLGIHLVAGSFTESHAAGRPTNTSLLIDPEGEIAAGYRKIHMFDVDIGGVAYRESEIEDAGEEVVVHDLDGARVGMAICYDLRFPELFRALVDRGANVFTLPSAFTVPTGRAHWETLIRARAIENQAFMLAAGQVGRAAPKFDSWGHSMIVDPWGEVLAVVERGVDSFAAADLDFAAQARIRAELPVLQNRRPRLFERLEPTGDADEATGRTKREPDPGAA
jgi:predicted amidohydrolase